MMILSARNPVFQRILAVVSASLMAMVAFPLNGQTRMDAGAYRKLLDERRNMTSDALQAEFNAGQFYDRIGYDAANIAYFDSVAVKYALTSYERELLLRNGFVVTERLSFDNYHEAFYDGYQKDLPVYISTDAVLHAFHRTNSNILKDIEKAILFRKITEGVLGCLKHLRTLPPSSDSNVARAREDVDVLLTVAGRLLETGYNARDLSFEADFSVVRTHSQEAVDTILGAISAEESGVLSAFTNHLRQYDYSQLKPRGHYAGDPVLESYFRALMWLGRTEIYITKPEGVEPPVSPDDVRRQCMMAVELATIVKESGARKHFDVFDSVLMRLVGEQDNLTLTNLLDIVDRQGLTTTDLVDPTALDAFQRSAVESGAAQQILSQILTSNGADTMKPAASFLLLGQRFILDSYVMGNLVFPHVASNRPRMMPSPLDVAFVLGNDAAIQLQRKEIDEYRYAGNLAALRLLTESLDTLYWNTSVYSSWLAAIRAVSPPRDRSALPRFMQTTAWWQKALNTQLGSWAELRHDFLLYAKQSYTGGLGCFYPSGYVEPQPEVFDRISTAAQLLESVILQAVPEEEPNRNYRAQEMLRVLRNTTRVQGILAQIARKELASEPLTADEETFIKSWIVLEQSGCVMAYNGHYQSLFYGVGAETGQQGTDFVVADVHTQPTDEMGNNVGRVLHVGTGHVNVMIVVAEDPSDKCLTSYVGPVGSYYEHATEGFTRLTDEEWSALTKEHAAAKKTLQRPSWTNVYLANANGQASSSDVPTLDVVMVSVGEESTANSSIDKLHLSPNPTPADMLVSFVVPSTMQQPADIRVVDASGSVIAVLGNHVQTEGTYYLRWNGRNTQGDLVPSATYFVVAESATGVVVKKAVVIR